MGCMVYDSDFSDILKLFSFCEFVQQIQITLLSFRKFCQMLTSYRKLDVVNFETEKIRVKKTSSH